MNADNAICEYDLFSMIKNSNDHIFIRALEQDIKDITKAFIMKQQSMGTSFNENVSLKNFCKINNVEKFLTERKNIHDIHQNFLNVFSNSPIGNAALQHSEYE